MDEGGLPGLLTQSGLLNGMVVVSSICGFMPGVNAGSYLLVTATMVAKSLFVPVLLLTAMGRMSAKSLFFLTGKVIVRLPVEKLGRDVAHIDQRIDHGETGSVMFFPLLFRELFL